MNAVSAPTRAPFETLLVDGPNIDGVLGQILGHRPSPDERPRWDRVKQYFPSRPGWKQCSYFVINRLHISDKSFPLFRFLRGVGWKVQPAEKIGNYSGNDDPVDEFILDQLHDLHALAKSGERVSVTLISHDHIFASVLKEILFCNGEVALVGFREEFAPELLQLESDGCEIIDLEKDVGAFNVKLSRLI